MKVEIKIPTMGESVTDAVVGNILVPSGGFVKIDQEILELETDKVNQVLYAPQSGQLSLTIQVNDTVTIGQVIGFVETDATAPTPIPQAEKPAAPAKEIPPPAAPVQTGPSARKMAKEFVAELNEPAKTPSNQPSLPKAQVAIPASQEGKTSRKRMSNLRKMVAQKLVEVKNQTAMLTTFNEVDMTCIMDIRAREKDNFQQRHGVKLGFMSFFVKATVAALQAYPAINSFLDGEDIVTWSTYDIGVAVSTDKGLMVPVIRECDALSFGQIELSLQEHAKKARGGTISIDDLRGGSFTITNGGVFGSLISTPILNPPQCAILGMHNIVKRPVVVNDQIVIRPMMYLALSYDHRIVDGRESVLFLVRLKEILEDPTRLLLDL